MDIKTPLVIVTIVGLSIMFFYLWREKFTIHKVDLPPCIPKIQQVGKYLLPHSAMFIISGFNYTENPKIYRDGKMVIPLQFSRDYVDMLYFYNVDAPLDICMHEWIVETYDYVKPLVYSGDATRYKVDLIDRLPGKIRWLVRC